ncbi:unnamed protein product [Gongylonema pulchrum]|uniref:Uncharacterized protein n=1 Tax=Gongylonema pulchrum TaxID=637853 RepID=A0A183D2T7_9BILA|nr:unnamed protein product [Gongylonema pulchrum]
MHRVHRTECGRSEQYSRTNEARLGHNRPNKKIRNDDDDALGDGCAGKKKVLTDKVRTANEHRENYIQRKL